ncbi:cellulose binding domain-containing protein [Actinomadura sediminis]|uniref:Cellulose binding domain-containing protein n=1 Tax=Actinomadura sediminis TaxID=1038904 RepID=A0ABW3EFH0_9ACTN
MMERRDGPGRAPGRHRSPEKPPPARGRLLTAAVAAFVLAGASLVGWALLNEPAPEPRAAGCAPHCTVAAPPEPSSPSQRPPAPAASDSVPSPTPSRTPTTTPTARASATPDGDRERGRGDRGRRDDDDRGDSRPRVRFTTQGDWGTNFIGAVTVANHGGRSVDAGTLVFGYGRGVEIVSTWGAPHSWSGGAVVARVGVLPPGGSATVTFQGQGRASPPDHCALDGRRC